MIALHDVHFRYGAKNWVLKGVNLTVGAGEYILISGLNGSGKSTLGCILNGLIPNFIDGELRGRVVIDGCDSRRLHVADLAGKVGMVLQNPDAQLFCGTVADDIAFGLANAGLDAEQIKTGLKTVARALRLEHLLERSPMHLSGGEKRLAAIASVLAVNPAVVVLDEPFADLDHDGMMLVLQALRAIHRSGKTVVVIEQKLEGLLAEITRCIVVARGTVIFDGSPRQAVPLLLNTKLIPRYPPRTPRHRIGNEVILKLDHLRATAEGTEILQNISFTVRAGESVALIGNNGAGKTTLIRHCNALLTPTQGAVTVAGADLRRKRTHELASTVGLAFQNPNDQFFKVRVRDELTVGPRAVNRLDEKWMRELCDLFELSELLERSPYRLSEGEKKRVAYASIFAMKPTLVILDEPTVGQDGRFRETMADFLKLLERFGFTLLIVTHDLDFARATTDRWLLLAAGEIVRDGPPESFVELNRRSTANGCDIGETLCTALVADREEVAHARS